MSAHLRKYALAQLAIRPHAAATSWSCRTRSSSSSVCKRGFSSSPNGENEQKKEQQEKKKGFEVPWGLMFVVVFVGTIGGYFYRGRKNQKNMTKLQQKMQDVAALDKNEVEEIRTENRLTLEQFELIRRTVKQRFPSGSANPTEFFAFVGAIVDPQTKALKAAHLYERLAMRLEEKKPLYDTKMLLCALSMGLESSVEDRLELLFKVFAKSGKDGQMKNSEVMDVVDSLIRTHQLPMRSLTREINHYPFDIFEPSKPLFLMTRAVEEVYKFRKKYNQLAGYEEENMNALKTALDHNDKANVIRRGAEPTPEGSVKVEEALTKLGVAPPVPEQPVWSLNDFSMLMYSKAVCAWGECHVQQERLEQEAKAAKKAKEGK